jgi:hypothetical protein
MNPTQSAEIGWTKAEYDAAPEMADRLQDENARLRAELQRVVDHSGCVHWPESGCAHAMRTIALVALGGKL